MKKIYRITMPNQIKDALILDPGASNWIKRAINELDQRDPVDALNDLEFLKMYIEHKLNDIHARNDIHASNAMDICNAMGIK